MDRYVICYNPQAGNDGRHAVQENLNALLKGNGMVFTDITKMGKAAAQAYFESLEPGDKIILAGGDGTINHFVNDVDCDNLNREIYLYASGNGNDFYKDLTDHLEDYYPKTAVKKENLNRKGTLIQIDKYLKNLPSVTVDGKTYKFINGVGYGIDGYCCEVGDRLRRDGKNVNYTSIAIKGLLFHFKPRTAKVTVDGKEYKFEKTWIAPAMHGRMYGGGMIPTPGQDRADGRKLSLCVMYGKGKLTTLMAFPKIFTGEHVKKENMVKVLEGKEITVQFDKPCALQIDGETILNVSEYTAKV